MSFLAPLFLFGALAVAVPLWLHLIRRRARERMPFSSLMFLTASPPRITRRSRLEHLVLLVLRCLAIGLLSLGFARPFFRKPLQPIGPSGQGKKVVLLVDTSASMRREGMWQSARNKAEELLRKVTPADQVAVLLFDRTVRQLVSFEQWSATGPADRVALAIQRLRETNPSWAATYLGNAIIAGAEALEAQQHTDEFSARQIVLISDLQEGGRLEGLQGFEWPRGIELIVESIKPKSTTNCGLQLLAESDDLTAAGEDVGPRIRVTNAADSKREQFKVRWDGAATNAVLEVYVPPGQSRIFPAPKLAAGSTSERLLLSGDDFDFDNSVYFLPPRAETVRITYFGNEAENDTTQPLFYLKRAFQQTQRHQVEISAFGASTNVTPAQLQGARLLIVTTNVAPDRVVLAKQFLQSGNALLLVLTSTAGTETLSQLLGHDLIPSVEEASLRYAMLGELNFQHPLLAPFGDPRFSDFTKIHFWKHRRLDLNSVPQARVLARFDTDNAPALFEVPVGRGTLLVLASGWQPADSQLALSSKFVPMLYSILDLAAGPQTHKVQFVIGDEVPMTVTNQPTRTVIRKPDGSQVEIASGERFTATDLPGIYTIASVQPPVRFAVNLDGAESRTAALPIETLERFGVPLKAPPKPKVSPQKQQHLRAAELESQQRLWRWVILATLVLLLIETAAAAWWSRPLRTQTSAS